MVEHHSHDFDGLLGYVGTETIGGQLTRRFLARVGADAVDLSPDDFYERLQYERGSAWVTNSLASALWIFVAGAERGELRFRYPVNADMLGHVYVNVSTGFRLVDDLDRVVIPRAMEETGASTKEEAMRGRLFFFRNGALLPAAMLFDSFTRLMEDVYRGGFENFDRVSSLDHYGALVRMRQEFIKRMFEPSKGLYSGGRPPIGGKIYVRSVDLQGRHPRARKEHATPGQSTLALLTTLRHARRLQAALSRAPTTSAVTTLAAPTQRSAAPYVR